MHGNLTYARLIAPCGRFASTDTKVSRIRKSLGVHFCYNLSLLNDPFSLAFGAHLSLHPLSGGTAAPAGVFVCMCCCVRFRLASELLFEPQRLYVFFSLSAKHLQRPTINICLDIVGMVVPSMLVLFVYFSLSLSYFDFLAPPGTKGVSQTATDALVGINNINVMSCLFSCSLIPSPAGMFSFHGTFATQKFSLAS